MRARRRGCGHGREMADNGEPTPTRASEPTFRSRSISGTWPQWGRPAHLRSFYASSPTFAGARSSSLSGIIVDSGGAPIAGAAVTPLEPATGWIGSGMPGEVAAGATVSTDADGRFTLKGLGADSIMLGIEHRGLDFDSTEGAVDGRPGWFDLVPGSEVKDVRIDAGRSGRGRRESRGPVPGARGTCVRGREGEGGQTKHPPPPRNVALHRLEGAVPCAASHRGHLSGEGRSAGERARGGNGSPNRDARSTPRTPEVGRSRAPASDAHRLPGGPGRRKRRLCAAVDRRNRADRRGHAPRPRGAVRGRRCTGPRPPLSSRAGPGPPRPRSPSRSTHWAVACLRRFPRLRLTTDLRPGRPRPTGGAAAPKAPPADGLELQRLRWPRCHHRSACHGHSGGVGRGEGEATYQPDRAG